MLPGDLAPEVKAANEMTCDLKRTWKGSGTSQGGLLIRLVRTLFRPASGRRGLGSTLEDH
jgi:hypothetical protein